MLNSIAASDPDPGTNPEGPVGLPTSGVDAAGAGLSGEVRHKVVSGTATLGVSVLIERGTGFLANILAARFGGVQTFGAYSFAISTANQISTYAAGGIGATAVRFSGKYPYGTRAYSTLARALAIVSLISAALAGIALWFGAGPIAHLLQKPQLTGLLRWAVLSAAGIMLLECARGFFVGQRRLAALVLLSVIVGVGMLTLLPAAAHAHSPIRMIVMQGLITTAAVLICLLLAQPLGLKAAPTAASEATVPLAPMLKEVWSFGLVQLAGLIGSNLAGWWLTLLVARTDTTLVQISFFSIASQLRNLVGIAPSLLTEGSYAVMAEPGEAASRTPHRVMALCSYASLGVALILAATGIVFVPWALTLLYGSAYAPAGMTVAIALAIAVVHMGNAPAAARLTIVSIRATGVINTVWAVFVALCATGFLFLGGGAWQAMAIYFVAHVLSSTLVLMTLKRKDHIPDGMTALFVFATVIAVALAGLSLVRGMHPELTLPVTGIMFLLLLLAIAGLQFFGKRYHWLPSAEAFQSILRGLRNRLPGRRAHV